MPDVKVGKVTHYYDKIGVAILKLTDGELKLGDQIKISKGDSEFTQTVTSMQIEHQPIEKAKKGDVIGLKVDQPVKENAEVYLIE